ncbi:MAG TPA: hypothetical protein VNU19_08035 [Candidatus Acidoferrum sp.]|nr:hypothetical protein [Candidatus Acidoferrum sp.]
MDRELNHVEFVYRPGERELAKRFFELWDCDVRDRGGTFFTVFIDSGVHDFMNNCFYASEVTPEQWAFELALQGAMQDEVIDGAKHRYLERLSREPQRSYHFGVRFLDLAHLESTVQRVAAAGNQDPDLVDRVAVSSVFWPGEPGSYSDTLVQAFVRTDVVASGLLTFGQHIELQWQPAP